MDLLKERIMQEGRLTPQRPQGAITSLTPLTSLTSLTPYPPKNLKFLYLTISAA